MKESNLSFADGFKGSPAPSGSPQRAFDWDKAAQIIKDNLKLHPDLKAEAGLQGDWSYTGGIIFENGSIQNEDYTFLSSNWAKPTLIISWDGEEQLELECWSFESDCRFSSGSKWDDNSLKILN